MLKIKAIPKASLLLIAFGFAYLALLVALGQGRAMYWGLTDDEMFFHEKLLSLAIAAGIISTWILGMYRAHKAGSWTWFIICLMCFPVAYVYTMTVNKGHEP